MEETTTKTPSAEPALGLSSAENDSQIAKETSAPTTESATTLVTAPASAESTATASALEPTATASEPAATSSEAVSSAPDTLTDAPLSKTKQRKVAAANYWKNRKKKKQSQRDGVDWRREWGGNKNEDGGVKRDKAATEGAEGGEEGYESKRSKIPKKKVALLLSYSGANYFGMQKNPGVVTIESKLFDALLASGAVSEENSEDLAKNGFQRCARTDKGVSARSNVVSLKVLLTDDMIEKTNEHLPEDIRIMGLTKVTKQFNSKNNCSARLYDYVLPTYSFAKTLEETNDSYRIDKDTLALVGRLLKGYEGTKRFHNFTQKKDYNDSSAKRFIMAFTHSEPFLLDGIEFIRCSVKGQSFMIHQIRKMIGLVIAISRGLCPESVMEESFNNARVDIPKAPGLGLMLNTVFFDLYNKKFEKTHEPLTWEKCQADIDAFATAVILSKVVQMEKESSSMLKWLTLLTRFHKSFIKNEPKDKTTAETAEEPKTNDDVDASSADGVENGAQSQEDEELREMKKSLF